MPSGCLHYLHQPFKDLQILETFLVSRYSGVIREKKGKELPIPGMVYIKLCVFLK